MYQVVACLIFSVLETGMQDSLYVGLMYTGCGHLDELKRRLANLGTTQFDDGENRDFRFYKDLMDCCRRYENCLRFDPASD